MRIKNSYLIISTLVLVYACSPLEKFVRQRDYEAMYREALKLYEKKKDNKAIYLFEAIENLYSGTPKDDTIQFYKAKAYYRKQDYDISSKYFDEFRKKYRRSPFLEESQYLYAMSFFEMAPISELDQSYSQMAINALLEFISEYPESPKVESCLEMIRDLQGRIYDKAYMVCETYYNIGAYNSAITTFKNVLKKYPEIPQREKILYMLVKSNYQYARASIEKKQRERYYGTIDAYLNFIADYPESKYRPEAERMYENANRLAKGEEIIEEVSKKLNVSDSKKKREERRIIKAVDKIDEGKISREEVEARAQKDLENTNRKIEKKQSQSQKNAEAAERKIEKKQLRDSLRGQKNIYEDK